MGNSPWNRGKYVLVILLTGCGLALTAAAFLFGGPRQAVDWSAIRAVAIESDDWGLPGFSPSLAAWSGLDRQELAPGHFPEVYWGSTLEDSSMVAELCRILEKSVGIDGLPAVFQPNYVMGSLEWEQGLGSGSWREFSFPEVPNIYARPGLMVAVREGMDSGLWYPELHARWHYDPKMRQATANESPLAREATRRGIMLFPSSEKARELGPWRLAADLERELSESQAIFKSVFGRLPGSIIAPDYTWNSNMETIWESNGLKVIQAKREQRNPDLGFGKVSRLQKFLQRKYEARRHPQRIYLERNCRLEPAQAADPTEVVARCVLDTQLAWRSGQPAIVESHRVNFAHLDPAVVSLGQEALSGYLAGITSNDAKLPIFLTDVEIAQLQVRGCSAVWRGQELILRNGTHSSKMVALPGGSLSANSAPAGANSGLVLVKIPAFSSIVLQPDGQYVSCSFGI